MLFDYFKLDGRGKTVEAWLANVKDVLNADFFDNTWAYEHGSARRVVFLYPNGEVYTLLNSSADTFDKQLWDVKGHSGSEVLNESWFWDVTCASWRSFQADIMSVATDLRELNALHGHPKVWFPWECFSSEASEYTDLDFFENLEIDSVSDTDLLAFLRSGLESADEDTMCDEWGVDEDEQESIVEAQRQASLILLSKNVLKAPIDLGSSFLQVSAGNYLLPIDSPSFKWELFLQLLDSRPDLVVNYNECCGTCFSGSVSALTSMKSLPESAPVFVIWGQNSTEYFKPDGSINYTIWCTATHAELFASIAHTVGLETFLKEDSDNFIELTFK